MSYYCNKEGPIADDELDLTNQWLDNLDEIQINPNLTWLDLTANRLKSVDPRILQLTELKMISLRQNLLSDAQFANDLKCKEKLEELILHDNALTIIPHLEGFLVINRLEFSYNEIRSLAPLKSLIAPSLKELYVANNKVSKIESLDGFQNLEVLELGSNRISTIENTDNLKMLKELWLGRNRISQIQNISHLQNLRKLSLQNNRLENMLGFQDLVNLEELYISCNGISVIEGIEKLTNLKVLDLASNRISRLQGLKTLSKLTDLWLDSNQIDQTFDEIQETVGDNIAQTVTVLYMDENPISKNKEEYLEKIRRVFPNLKQLDSNDV